MLPSLSITPKQSESEQSHTTDEEHQGGAEHPCEITKQVDVSTDRPDQEIQNSTRKGAATILSQSNAHQPKRDGYHCDIAKNRR